MGAGQIRHQQCHLLAHDLGAGFNGLVGGDFNTLLDDTGDTEPLSRVGFRLVDADFPQSTQIQGSRLDGFFVRNEIGSGQYGPKTVKRTLSENAPLIKVRSFWSDPFIKRHLSDHSLLTGCHDSCLCDNKGPEPERSKPDSMTLDLDLMD